VANKPAKKNPAEEEPEIEIPKDRVEAAEFVRKVGALKIEISAVNAQAEAKIATIKQDAESSTAGSKKEIEALVEGLFVFFEIDSPELTEDGARKSVDLGTGVIGVRLSPWKVEIKGVEDVLRELERMGISNLFVRQIRRLEINKEAMLSTETSRELASRVKGVSVVHEEVFFVSPCGLGGVDITSPRKIKIGKQRKGRQRK